MTVIANNFFIAADAAIHAVSKVLKNTRFFITLMTKLARFAPIQPHFITNIISSEAEGRIAVGAIFLIF